MTLYQVLIFASGYNKNVSHFIHMYCNMSAFDLQIIIQNNSSIINPAPIFLTHPTGQIIHIYFGFLLPGFKVNMSEDSLERCFTANSNIVIQHNHQDLDFDQFRPVSPNFKGFTKLNRIYSKNIRRKCVQSWRKHFRGFTSNDYKQTNGAWRRSKELLCHISGPVTSSSFLGMF